MALAVPFLNAKGAFCLGKDHAFDITVDTLKYFPALSCSSLLQNVSLKGIWFKKQKVVIQGDE